MESSRAFEQLNQVWYKLPQQKLSSFASLFLLIYTAHLISGLIWEIVPASEDHGDISIQSQRSATSAPTESNVDISKLLRLDLFGKYQATVAKPKPVVKTNNAPKTKLNVTLTGLVADSSSDTSETSMAIIENRSQQSSYGIGEMIEGTSATVHQIFIDRVILLVNGRYETLMLEGIEYSTTVPGAPVPSEEQVNNESVTATSDTNTTTLPKPPQPAEKLDKRQDTQLSQTLREQRTQLFEDPKKLLDYIRIRPQRESGKLIGYRLTPGKDPELFRQVGLKHNDLATNINGYDLTDMQQALSVMKELKTMTEANITVMRNDSPIEIILAL